jgi:WD40 repeat protein
MQRLYSETRGSAAPGFNGKSTTHTAAVLDTDAYSRRVDLERFSDTVSLFASKNRLRVVGELTHVDLLSTSPSASIVSSIEFDFEKRLFATAGVSRRIQFFDFRDVCGAGDAVSGTSASTPPDPKQSIVTRCKLSCLSYNPVQANHVASSDYEGTAFPNPNLKIVRPDYG